MTIVMLLMLLAVILVLAFFAYQLFEKYQLEGLTADTRKMRRKINVYKNRQNSKQILYILIGLVVLCVLLVGMLYNQYYLNNKIEKMETKVEGVQKNSGGGTADVESYTEKDLKLSEFTWDKILSAGDQAALANYEVQLSSDWEPYFGDTNVTIIKSDATKTMTLSVAATSLSNDGYQTAKKNAETFVKELNSVEQVTMIDFNFTYRNESKNLSKDTLVYSKADKGKDFEKVSAE